MRVGARTRVALGLALTIGTSCGLSRAEVSTSVSGDYLTGTLILGVGDDPDPIGMGVWLPYRDLPSAQFLNPAGYSNGEGRPDLAWPAASSRPAAVWAATTGSSHDVAFSEWDGTSWTGPESLTFGGGDDLDPRVFVEPDGAAHVVWWTAGASDAVFLASRPAGSATWSTPVQVSAAAESGRRPSVAVHDGVLRVAYERPGTTGGMAQEVVVRRREPNGTFTVQVVAATPRAERLDVVLHAEAGRVWADWKQDGGSFGYSRTNATGWDAPSTSPWDDASWLGVESARRSIRRSVLGP